MRGKKRLLLFITSGLLLSCGKQADFSSIQVVGHAGMGLENSSSFYHDNSLPSIEMALSIDGCQGVEVDVQRAADGSLWLYHDDKLETQTNHSSCISALTANELNSITYNTINKENLLQFSELPWQRLKQKRLFLDIRHYNGCTSTILNPQEMIHSIKSQLPTNHEVDLAIILNRRQWVDDFVAAGFNVFLHVYPEKDDFQEIKLNYTELHGVIIKNNECKKEDVQFWQDIGKKVVIFEMRSPKGIRNAFNKFPDEVITDDIRATLIEKY